MRTHLIRAVAGTWVVLILAMLAAQAQSPPAPPGTPLSPAELEQLLAPIALYPDALVAQILMAATYPLEVVQADRWLQDVTNAALAGDQLTAALQSQPWDPSVKSLVPFPEVVHMMDENLDWTERLGDAFLAQQAAVMDAVQRLRARALAAGTLASTPQQTVLAQDQVISIVAAAPDVIYVPVYNPNLVYGVWLYPAYPPIVLLPGPRFGTLLSGGIGFGVGITLVGPLWGWSRWDWREHRIEVDVARFNAIQVNRPPLTAPVWTHDPLHRRGVPYRDVGTRTQFEGRSMELRRAFRGYEGRPAPAAPPVGQPPAARGAARPPTPPSPRPVPPAFESFGRGPDVRTQAERGRVSRQPAPPMPAPRIPAPRPAAPPVRPAPGGARPGGGGPHR